MLLKDLSQCSSNALRVLCGLPLHIGYRTELIESFMIDRRAVKTEKQLKAFTKHWNSVWKFQWDPKWAPTRSETQLVSGRYDVGLALRCVSKNGKNGEGCSHLKNNRHCISADIMAPAFLICLLELREKFGVPDGVALIQLTRALHADLRDIDPDDIFTYINEHRQ